eukprot:1157303-Pelagomonas_calceolata.AAC.13
MGTSSVAQAFCDLASAQANVSSLGWPNKAQKQKAEPAHVPEAKGADVNQEALHIIRPESKPFSWKHATLGISGI